MKAAKKIMASALALTMAASIGAAAFAESNIATASGGTATTQVTISSAKVVREQTQTVNKLPVYETETITDSNGDKHTIVKTDEDGNPIAKTDENGNIIYQKDENNNDITDYKYKETEITVPDGNGGTKTITVIEVDESGLPEADTDGSGNQQTVAERIVTTLTETNEVAAPTFSVTLPTTLSMAITAGGETATGNFSIGNDSAGPVKVTGIKVKGDEWSLASYADDFASKQVNSRQLGLQLSVTGDEVATTTATAKGVEQALTINDPAAWTIARGDDLTVTTNAKTTAVSEAITAPEKAADIIFTVGWDTAANG